MVFRSTFAMAAICLRWFDACRKLFKYEAYSGEDLKLGFGCRWRLKSSLANTHLLPDRMDLIRS